MRQQTTFHNFERRQERLKERIWPEEFPSTIKIKSRCTNFSLTTKNKEILKRFLTHLSNSNYGIVRMNRLLEWCAILGEMLGKDFDTITEEDIHGTNGILAKIQKKWSNDRTKEAAYVALKQFYKWFYKKKLPDYFQDIKLMKRKGQKYSKDILTKEEILILIQKTTPPNIKAIITTLIFSGCRISELGLSTVRDFQFNSNKEVIFTIKNSKTQERNVLILGIGVPILKNWFENFHPLRKEKDYLDSPAFVSITPKHFGERMNYAAIRKALFLSMERAGIKKSANPHHFRHCFGTLAFLDGYTESEIAMLLGHADGSKSTRIYTNFTELNVFEKMRRKADPKAIITKAPDPFQIGDGLAEHNQFEQLKQNMRVMEEKMRIMQELIQRKIDPDIAERSPIEELKKVVAKN